MKKVFSTLVVLLVVAGILHAQEYKQVKVNMANGLQMKGSSASIQNDTISIQTNGLTRIFSLSEVNSMMAKSGKAEKYAIGCGSGCLGYCIINLILLGESGLQKYNTTIGQYAAESFLYIGLFAGTGYLIGALFDPYEVVYIKESSFLKKVRVSVSADPLAVMPITEKGTQSFSLGTPMLNLSYRF